jgi:hypothetical protein
LVVALCGACSRSSYGTKADAPGDAGDSLIGDLDAPGGDAGSGDDARSGGDATALVVPEPDNVQLVPLSATEVRVTWQPPPAGSIPAATGYRIAYTTAPAGPADCASGSVVPEGEINATRRIHVLTSLTPFTTYRIAVCSVAAGSLSAPVGSVTTTFPLCDYPSVDLVTLDTSGDSRVTFDEFQTFLDAATDVVTSDGAGKTTLCLADNLRVTQPAGSTLPAINVTMDDVYLLGREAGGVLFENRVTTLADVEQTIFLIDADGFAIAHVAIEADGSQGEGIDVHSAGVDFVESVTFTGSDTTTGASGAAISVGRGPSTIGRLTNLSVTWGVGLYLNPSPGNVAVGTIRNVAITAIRGNGDAFQIDGNSTSTVAAIEWLSATSIGLGSGTGYGIYVSNAVVERMEHISSSTVEDDSDALFVAGSIGSLRTAVLLTTARDSSGITLGPAGAIGALDGVTIVRSRDAVDQASAIVVEPATTAHFGDVANVVICSELGAAVTWEDHPAGPAWGLLIDEGVGPPTVHVPWAGGPAAGAKTFPFAAPLAVGSHPQGIVMGGGCAVP